MGKKILQGNLDVEGSLWLSGDVTVGGSDDEAAKKLATEKYVDTKMSGVETYIDQKVIDKTTDLESHLNTVEAIALGATKAISYFSYLEMVNELNTLPKDFFKPGQDINVVTVKVPDIWVAYVDDEHEPYTYIDDNTIEETLKTVGLLKIGYFRLGQKETGKVELVDYAKKDEITTVKASLKDNGAYTLIIIQGVE